MKLGISSFSYTWGVGVPGQHPSAPIGAQDLLRRAQSLGVSTVQFGDNLPLGGLTTGERQALSVLALDLGLHVEVGTRGIGENLTEYLGWAVMLRSPLVRVVIDKRGDEPSWTEAIARLRPVEAQFRDAGVRLAIENHDRFSVAQLADLVDELGDWTGICLDTVNSFGALENLDNVVQVLGPRAINLHIKDFAITRPDHAMGFLVTGTPAGQGRLDIPGTVAALNQYGVGSGILELWVSPGDSLQATIDKEERWVEESIEYLHTVPGLTA